MNGRAADAQPAETDQFKLNAKTDAEYMFANPGLDTEAHRD